MKKVMVFGTFDILHKGHFNFFRQARKYGDYLIAIVARDKTVLAVKRKLPRNSEKIRLNNLKNNNLADKVVLGGLKNKHAVIKRLKPDLICLGYDQKAFIKGLKKAPILKARFAGANARRWGRGGKKIKIVRLKPYKPEIYKSSKIKLPL
jgi:FAD synthetase